MIPKETIKKLAERILKNVPKTESTGLYNGKAGLSLSLFFAADYLEDEKMDDAAYKLLLESLIIKNSDLSFENGLSGVGYALLYLLEKQMAEADFDDVFRTPYETIIRNFENIEKFPYGVLNMFPAIAFLTKVGDIKKDDERVRDVIKKFFEGVELYLTVQFRDFTEIGYINKKLNVLSLFNTYLKLVDYSGYAHFSSSLLDIYASIYRKGRIISSLEMGYCLKKICIRNNINQYDDLIHENIANGIKNIHFETLSLRERIDLVKILSDIDNTAINEQHLLPEIEKIDNDMVIYNLQQTIDEHFFPFGYGAGLGRLLIYCIDNKVELL